MASSMPPIADVSIYAHVCVLRVCGGDELMILQYFWRLWELEEQIKGSMTPNYL